MSQTAQSQSSLVGAVSGLLSIVIFGGGMYIAYYMMNGLPVPLPSFFDRLRGENALEKAVNVGVARRSDMDDFSIKGGLDKESTWHGFKTRTVETAYHPSGKLGMVTLNLHKTWPGLRIASMENLQAAMSPLCGSDWHVTVDRGTAMLQQSNPTTGVACSAIHNASDRSSANEVHVVIAQPTDRTGASAAAATAQPAPDRQPEPQPTRNFEAEARAEFAFPNPQSMIIAPADAGAIRATKSLDSIYQDSRFDLALHKLTGKDYDLFLDYHAVRSTPVLAVDRTISGDGMAPHSGGLQMSAFALVPDGRLVVVIGDSDKKPRYSIYGAASLDQIPASLAKIISSNR